MSIPFSNSSFVALAIVFVFSCSKPVADNGDITGSWNWVSRDGGIANHIHETPASTGKNIMLVLGIDKKYTITENGVITSQGTYTIGGSTCIHDLRNKQLVNFSSTTEKDMMVEAIDGNTLVLSDEVNDGTNSTYSR